MIPPSAVYTLTGGHEQNPAPGHLGTLARGGHSASAYWTDSMMVRWGSVGPRHLLQDPCSSLPKKVSCDFTGTQRAYDV